MDDNSTQPADARNNAFRDGELLVAVAVEASPWPRRLSREERISTGIASSNASASLFSRTLIDTRAPHRLRDRLEPHLALPLGVDAQVLAVAAAELEDAGIQALDGDDRGSCVRKLAGHDRPEVDAIADREESRERRPNRNGLVDPISLSPSRIARRGRRRPP